MHETRARTTSIREQAMEENGRVQFDRDRPHKTLEHEDAQDMLMLLYERHRGTFGALLAEVVTGMQYRAVKPR